MIPVNSLIDITVKSPSSKTLGIDFETGRITSYISGLEAVKQAAFIILNTERFRHQIYTWAHGIESEDLLGRESEYVYPELSRRIKEALSQDERIKDTSDFEYSRMKEQLNVSFVMNTIFGTENVEVTVNV